MIGLALRLITSRLALLGMGALAVVGLVRYGAPNSQPESNISPLHQAVDKEVASLMASMPKQIPRRPDVATENQDPRPLVLIDYFSGDLFIDQQWVLRDTLRDRIRFHNYWRTPDENLWQRTREQLGLPQIMTPLKPNERKEAISHYGADGFLSGKINAINRDGQGDVLTDFDLELYDYEGNIIWSDNYEPAASLTDTTDTRGWTESSLRAALALLLILVTPLLINPWLRSLLSRQHNPTNAAVLLGTSLICTAIAWGIMGAIGIPGLMLAITFFLAALAWNGWLLGRWASIAP